jgi:hypothetical protein
MEKEKKEKVRNSRILYPWTLFHSVFCFVFPVNDGDWL